MTISYEYEVIMMTLWRLNVLCHGTILGQI